MTAETKIIDSHVHLDLVALYHPDRIQFLKDASCGVISWAYFEAGDSVSGLRDYLEAKAAFIKKNYDDGLDCSYLAGVHPRWIPPDLKPEEITSLLQPYMDDPLCRGIGEIGLETGDSREKEIFIAQLEFAAKIAPQGKVAGIHTPRSNKGAVTELILDILVDFKDISSSIIVDHCTPETISQVLDAGLWAGVTLSPVKASLEDLKKIVLMNPDRINRIICNTDSGGSFYEDVVKCRRNKDLSEFVRSRLFFRNAADFYKIDILHPWNTTSSCCNQ